MAKLYQLIADVLSLPVAQVTDELSMKNSPVWDSLKHMELIVTIERDFAVELTGDEIAEMTSVAAIKTILVQRGI